MATIPQHPVPQHPVPQHLVPLIDAYRTCAARVIPGADRMGPIAMIRKIRELRRTVDRYLARRGLARPAVPWREYQDLREPARAGAGAGMAS